MGGGGIGMFRVEDFLAEGVPLPTTFTTPLSTQVTTG
jgi:hypothetical protein